VRLGWTEVLVVLAIALLLFGTKRLPALGKSLGKSLRSFKRGVTGIDEGEGEDSSSASPALEAKLGERPDDDAEKSA
jgi:sec-independent protein translocase protein TatA